MTHFGSEDTPVKTVALNNYLPMKCSMGGGCNETLLEYGNWQKEFVQGAENVTVFQDTETADLWNREFGCGHDDLIIYDRFGTVASYLPSRMTQAALKIPSADWLEQDLKTAEGQKNILDELRRVTAIDSQERCHVQPTPHASGSRNPDTTAGAVFLVFIVLLAVAGYVVYKRNTTGYNILGGGGEHKFQVLSTDADYEDEEDWNVADDELDDDDLNEGGGSVELSKLGNKRERYGSGDNGEFV